MLWECGHARAERALSLIADAIGDMNELRVCLPSDLVGMIGSRYPRAEERSRRLRASLGAVYEREHAMSLSCLEQMTKRDARALLDGLEGMVPFVASRVMLLELGGHSLPMDARLCGLAREMLALDEKPDGMAARLERVFHAGELAPVYRCLERLHAQEAGGVREVAREAAERSETEAELP
jgi:hypothetical protein